MSSLPPLPPELDPRGRHRGGGVRAPGLSWRPVLWLTRVVAAALSVFLLITFGVYWQKYHAFNSGLKKLNVFGNSISKPKTDIDGKDQNILIVGNDDRETATDAELAMLGTGRDGGSLNTDTMMLVHVPADGKRATLVSFPRDSYVQIPGFGRGKLNSASPDAYGATSGTTNQKRTAGARELVETLQQLTGVTIDHFVQVDLLGFYRISLAIGPVTVNMCQSVTEPESGINLHQGVNQIVGKQALAFVRQRYNFPNGLGDLDRVQRQRYFLTAAFRKVTSLGTLANPNKLQSLLDAVKKSVYMDDTMNPLQLASQMADLSADNIGGQTIPTDGFGHEDGSTVEVNPAEVQAFMKKLLSPPAKTPAAQSSTAKAPTTSASAASGSAHASTTPQKPIDAGCIE
jgi:LCP family protein required for cell wall assembly